MPQVFGSGRSGRQWPGIPLILNAIILPLLLLSLALPACGYEDAQNPSKEGTPRANRTATRTPTPTPTPAVDYWVATVVDVESGDRAQLDNGLRVQYIGLECPESGEYGFEQSREFNRSLVVGQQVRLEVDKDHLYDRAGRLLAYVWVGDQLINFSVVRGGWARPVKTYGIPNHKKWEWLIAQGQKQAQAERTGIWFPLTEAGIPSAAVTYYDVYGSSAYELYDSIDELGPEIDGKKAVGVTSWRPSWRAKTLTDYWGNCQITSYWVDCPIEVTLPRWSPPAGTRPELIASWNEYFLYVVEHEKRHVDIVLEGLPKAEQAFAGSDCETAEYLANEAFKEIETRNEQFDIDTENGTKDGVSLIEY